MEKIIEKAKALIDQPLSSQDILDFCGDQINIIKYTDLDGIQNINEILMPYGACVILYQSGPKFGHWVLLMNRQCKDGQKVLEFFDSYGIILDDELKQLHYVDGAQMSNKFKYLTWLILNSGYDHVISNEYPFQTKGRHIQTCGRWCVIRYLMRNKTLSQFAHLFDKYNQEPGDLDLFVCILTLLIKNQSY